MKIKAFSAFFILLLAFEFVVGQDASTQANKSKWSANPFDHQFFIENKGQFDKSVPAGNKVLFQVILGNYAKAYLTPTGIIYGYDEIVKADNDDDEISPVKNEDADRPLLKTQTHYLDMQWQDAAPSVEIMPEQKRTDYYVYPTGKNSSIKVSLYSKIVYHNLYPGIDAEYTFIKGKPGLEYSLIVHPGADLSNIKIKYSGATILSKDGNLVIKGELANLTEYSPSGFYQDDNSKVNSGFALKDNIASFYAEGIDKARTLVIDPWVTDPLFSNAPDYAYDIDFDDSGNVYAYGSFLPFQLVQLNSAGVIQWTFNANTINTNVYGDFAVDKKIGNSYICEGGNLTGSGANVLKLNKLGTLISTFPGNTIMQEMWRMIYNDCSGKMIIGGGGTTGSYQGCMLDTDMINLTPVDAVGAVDPSHDIALISTDPSGGYAYIATTESTAYPADFNNVVIKIPVPALTPSVYVVYDGFDFIEISSIPYVGGGAAYNHGPSGGGTFACANGMNGMAASFNWLYMYDGAKLRQCDKTTGLRNDSINITKTHFTWGGLDVDACDDIYVGVRDSIHIYNSTLALDTVIKMPDTVYDLELGHNGLLYACGRGFITQIEAPVLPKIISTAAGYAASSCSACDGRATVNVNCGTPPFAFLWQDGQTGQTDTDLCPGTYSVTVTDGSCPPNVQTANVKVEPGVVADINVPNVFTPNGDGVNDLFSYVVPNHIEDYSVVIYDRWGLEMFKTTDPTAFWNGKINNSGSLVSDGTYYYIIKAVCGALDINKKGFLQVIGERK